jgi:hypothetical protein
MLMVVAMVRRPPQRTALRGAGTQHAKQELRRAAGFKGLVGEIPVVKSRDRKHADHEEGKGEHQGKGTNACKKGQETRQVQTNKGQHSQHVKGSGTGVQVI